MPRTRVQKWGNSLGIRIPREIAVVLQIQPDTLIEITCVEGHLLLTPVHEPPQSLHQLVAQITEQNRRSATDAWLLEEVRR